MLWGVVVCVPHYCEGQTDPSILLDLINVIEQLLKVDADLAKSYKLSPHVLSAVADILDSVSEYLVSAENSSQSSLPAYLAGKTLDVLKVFDDNLFQADKQIRLSTLRILCHFETILSDGLKKEETNAGICNNVFVFLRSIEQIDLSVSTSQKAILLISKIQTALCDCLTFLISHHDVVVWDRYVKCVEYWQTAFLSSLDHIAVDNSNSTKNTEIWCEIIAGYGF
ncbi:hypothetical protein M569_05588 [Genlisea aurea]|uniref:Uncharacterized protein n=1 Tax=Genlisea aurea TaxID=192259 RepID=S8CPR3_9LAMI|nr:hypothetical protein M569_05588 [Genlisea aurea]